MTVVVTVLAYRRITAAGRLMVVFWVGMLATVAWVIFTGLTHFNPSIAFDFPENAWKADGPWMVGLGMALGIAMYDYLGYYQICYLGEEVADTPRTIPRAILISTLGVSLIYLVMNVSILGVLPWREVLGSHRVATDMILRVYGEWAASIVTVMIIWTALASAFAAILGYSRIPYASARSGNFFRFFAATHPRGESPTVRSCSWAGSRCSPAGRPADRDHGAAHLADPHPVHRTDRDPGLLEVSPRSTEAGVRDAALPVAHDHRHGRLDVHLRDLDMGRRGIRSGISPPGFVRIRDLGWTPGTAGKPRGSRGYSGWCY